MGIETGLVALGMSATTASAVATGVITAAASAALAAATAPKKPKDAPTPAPTVTKPPPGVQAEKPADRNAMLNRNALAASAAGALSGNSSTLLTGSQGVTGGLNLGGSTLLGQ